MPSYKFTDLLVALIVLIRSVVFPLGTRFLTPGAILSYLGGISGMGTLQLVPVMAPFRVRMKIVPFPCALRMHGSG